MQHESSKVGRRVVVTGMAGAGKSTFSKVLAAKTGLPLIHLDLYIWQPGWVRVPTDELLAIQQDLLAEERWIVDSNDVDDDLLVERADTLIVIATPWWLCSWRAFLRGLKRPAGVVLPAGCKESFSQRLKDEWGIVVRNFLNRKQVADRDQVLVARCTDSMFAHTLRSKHEINLFLRDQ